jgi:outer membrane lipoprotein-sorting protein
MATGLAVIGALLAAAAGEAAAAAESKDATAPSISVQQIVERHVAARGGLAAWHAVQTLSVRGKMEAGSGDSVARSTRLARDGAGARARAGAKTASSETGSEPQQVELPFRLEMKRPHKSRVEIDFAGQTAVQVYDGQNGWKVRPFLNRNDVEPFSEQEAKSEAERASIEGPLFDYAAKGSKVALEGVESVDGHSAYRLKLTLKSGDVQHIWIDSQSFLDVKVEGIPRRMDNKMRTVWVYQRDFRPVQGLMVPFLYETVAEGSPHGHKMRIESVLVNRDMDDSRFTKPQPLLAAAPHLPAPAPVVEGKPSGGK